MAVITGGFLLKLKFILPLLLTTVFVTAGCQAHVSDSATTQNAYEKIQTIMVNMKTYESQATVEYKSNKGSNTYETVQKCRSTGEYRVEVVGPDKVAGNITISDGKTIYQYNTRLSGKIAVATKESLERSEIFFTSFIKNYLQSMDTAVSVAKISNDPCTVLEAVIPGDHPYLATEKLWVDNETLKPVKLIIYDPQGSERILVTYKTFEYNVALDDSVFQPAAA
jgi:outer membrane lipoprotein-sorting protein